MENLLFFLVFFLAVPGQLILSVNGRPYPGGMLSVNVSVNDAYGSHLLVKFVTVSGSVTCPGQVRRSSLCTDVYIRHSFLMFFISFQIPVSVFTHLSNGYAVLEAEISAPIGSICSLTASVDAPGFFEGNSKSQTISFSMGNCPPGTGYDSRNSSLTCLPCTQVCSWLYLRAMFALLSSLATLFSFRVLTM
jgi:hypothetical protein